MGGQPLPAAHLSRAADRACVGHVSGLDAWLSVDVGSTPRAATRPSRKANWDWDAPPLHARLVYDTGVQGLPLGIRAVMQAGSRRLMFAADEYEAVLRVDTDGLTGRNRVVGELLHEGLPLAGVPVRLRAAGSPLVCLTDRAGAFRAASLVDGSYRIEVPVGDYVLTIAPVSLGRARARD